MRAISLIITVAATLSLAGLTAAIAVGNSTSRSATVSTARTGLGRIIVNGQGRTPYLFEKDRRGHSACSGTCATYWPPLITRGKPIAANGARQALLGTIRRADGSRQVTYAGHPVYRFRLDSKRGQTSGEGLNDFGGGWDALSPAGKKIEGD